MVEGIIARTFTKDWTAPDGKRLKLHSFKLEEFPDEFFRTGTKPVSIKEGSLVRFEPDDKFNVKPENIELVTASPAPKNAETAEKASAPKQSSLGRETYWDEKAKADEARQLAITYQAARKDALEFVEMSASLGALPLPEANSARMDVLLAAVDSFTLRFVEDTHRLAPPTKSETPVEVAKAAKKPRGRPRKAAEPAGEQPEVDLG